MKHQKFINKTNIPEILGVNIINLPLGFLHQKFYLARILEPMICHK